MCIFYFFLETQHGNEIQYHQNGQTILVWSRTKMQTETKLTTMVESGFIITVVFDLFVVQCIY